MAVSDKFALIQSIVLSKLKKKYMCYLRVCLELLPSVDVITTTLAGFAVVIVKSMSEN